ncbi:hypothetical protein A6A40_17185 (plasmid) [Azospirillum humicireducens]|uniref:Uncharacterized protein n=1 Tax=Azospirillum humicireducens TaxID=1226968 RepID=A0A2R4VQR5_9PROT|nr:hypothetical protein [Azospirillum humicireducens]AWB06788.1 hypothetical protein A6A40_17185 [Azospirillum humicireducens]
MSSKKISSSLVVEVVQATGLRLNDESVVKLEKLLGEVGARVARQYPAQVAGNGQTILDRVGARLDALIGQLDAASSRKAERSDIVDAAACLLAWVAAMDLLASSHQHEADASIPALTVTSVTEGMA